mgnify:CR=1 FL=1
MTLDDALLPSPGGFLRGRLGALRTPEILGRYEAWMEERGMGISEAVDRAGTAPLRMHDRFGNRIDEVVFPPGYRELLTKGYEAGVVFKAVEEGDLPAFTQDRNLSDTASIFFQPTSEAIVLMRRYFADKIVT